MRVSPVFDRFLKSLVKVELTLKLLGDDPFVLDLEWNKPTTSTHPLGIDIEVV